MDQGIELHLDSPDYEAAIILKANKLSLNVSAILELAHTKTAVYQTGIYPILLRLHFYLWL
jgi:hypothetical protein